MKKLFALAVMLEQRADQFTTSRQIIGYRRSESKDEAVGNFVLNLQKENPGFQMGEVVTIEIPELTCMPSF